jgi:beta-lactamase superfamily II metal-dependent hydrolase
VLLCSDLDRHGQRTLLSHGDELRADVVVASVPRDGEPLIDPLLTAIRPRLVIITDGEFPATQRVKPALRERFARGAWQALYTSDVGAVTLTCGPRGCRVCSAIGGAPFWISLPLSPMAP